MKVSCQTANDVLSLSLRSVGDRSVVGPLLGTGSRRMKLGVHKPQNQQILCCPGVMSLLEAARNCESHALTAWNWVTIFSFCARAALRIRTPLTHRLHLLCRAGGCHRTRARHFTPVGGGGAGCFIYLFLFPCILFTGLCWTPGKASVRVSFR